MRPTLLPAVQALTATLADVAPHIANLPRSDRALVLKPAVADAVDALKGTGLSSAQVEGILLSLIAEAWPARTERDSADDVRAWCIQRYFEPRSTVSEPNPESH
ncbi:MAG TPA: hypothetical protein VGQ56_07795 [Gemmatimonadaceae bacterium]|jgi:hypothetical protein|nr:hypothetical protein [Gemmatimonadaceae bacterium]